MGDKYMFWMKFRVPRFGETRRLMAQLAHSWHYPAASAEVYSLPNNILSIYSFLSDNRNIFVRVNNR